MRPLWAATSTPGAKASSSVPPRATGMPGAKEIVESQAIGVEHQPQRAGGVHRQVLIHDDRQRAGGRSRGRVAVVVADDQRRAGRQVEARNVPVGLNQIAGVRAGQRGEIKVRSSRVGPAQVRAGEVSAGEVTDSSSRIQRNSHW